MPSYVITGVSRGIGWAMLENITKNPENILVGLVRNKAATEKQVAEAFPDRTNITILQVDLTDYTSLEKASKDTAAVTGGSLDYLIGNAAMMSDLDGFNDVTSMVEKSSPEVVTKLFRDYFDTNPIGTYHLFNLFTPLLLRGSTKKAAAITSGHADLDLPQNYFVDNGVAYAASKAAQNMIVSKFHARYAQEGALFVSICPGVVDTRADPPTDPDDIAAGQKFVERMLKYNPDFKGLKTAPVVAEQILSLIYDSTVEKQGGGFISHNRTDRWV